MAGQPPITEGQAWKEYPDAEDTAAACTGSKFIHGLLNGWDNKFFSRLLASPDQMDKVRIDVAKQALAGLESTEQRKLPNSAKVYAASALPKTQEGYDTRAKVLDASPFEDMGYYSWQSERQAKMYRALEADPLVADAQKRWNEPGFSEEDKLQVARRIHQIQMDSFGGQAIPIRSEADERSHGVHSSLTHDIKLSNSPGAGLNQPDFNEFVNTVTHESMHALQDQIVERADKLKEIDQSVLADLKVKSAAELSPEGRAVYESERARKTEAAFPGDPNGWNKELGEDGRLDSIVPMLRFQNNGGYMPSSRAGSENYRVNPVEQQAFRFGDDTGAFMAATPAERKATIEKHESYGELLQQTHGNRIEERKATLPSTKPCV